MSERDTGVTVDQAEMDALAAEAARIDGADAAPAEPDKAEPTAQPQSEFMPSTAQLVAGGLLGVGRVMSMRYPALSRVYTQERCAVVGECVGPALDEMGFDPASSKVMKFVTALGALLLLSIDTVEAIRGTVVSGHGRPGDAPAGGPAPRPMP